MSTGNPFTEMNDGQKDEVLNKISEVLTRLLPPGTRVLVLVPDTAKEDIHRISSMSLDEQLILLDAASKLWRGKLTGGAEGTPVLDEGEEPNEREWQGFDDRPRR